MTAAALLSAGPTAAPPEGTVYNSAVDYAWTGGGSAPLEYSYYLEGWSGGVNYIRGFTGERSPDWSPWSAATSVRLCFVAPGLYTFHLRVRDVTGRIGVYHETRTFLGTAQTDICDGALVKGSADAVYVVLAALRRHVPNLPTFEAQRFLWTNINHVPDSTLYAIPAGQPLLDALADGNLLRGSGPEVYVMQSGLRRHVTSPAVMDSCQYGWDAIYAVPNSLALIATGAPLYGPPCPRLSPPQGSLVKGPGPEVYLMQGGLRRHVPNPVSFFAAGLLWGNVNTIPGSSLSTIPTGQPLLDSMADGNLLKGGGPEVYVMQSGLRRHVTSPAVMDSCQYGWDAVRFVPDWLLATISTASSLYGPPCPHLVPPHGVLVKGNGPQVYLMQLGLKRHIPNPVTFEARGLPWGNINTIPNSALNTIPTGQPLLDALADGNLLRGGGPEVYAMEDGARRLIDGATAMDDCNYGTDAVQVITNSLLGSIPGAASLSGPPCPHLLPPEGALVKGTAPAVYVMEGGRKRHVVDPNAFHGCGYQWGNINLIPDSSLAGVPTGAVLTDPPCPH